MNFTKMSLLKKLVYLKPPQPSSSAPYAENIKVKVHIYSPETPEGQQPFTAVTHAYIGDLSTVFPWVKCSALSAVEVIHTVSIYGPPYSHYCLSMWD